MAIYDSNTAFKGLASIPRAGSWTPRARTVSSLGLDQATKRKRDFEQSIKPYPYPVKGHEEPPHDPDL